MTTATPWYFGLKSFMKNPVPSSLLAGFSAGPEGEVPGWSMRRESTLVGKRPATEEGCGSGSKRTRSEEAAAASGSTGAGESGKTVEGEGVFPPPPPGLFMGVPMGGPMGPALARCPPAFLTRICGKPFAELTSTDVGRLLGAVSVSYDPACPWSLELIQRWIKEPKTMSRGVAELIPAGMPAFKSLTEIFKSGKDKVYGYRAAMPDGKYRFIKMVRVETYVDYIKNLSKVLIQNYLAHRYPGEVPKILSVHRTHNKQTVRIKQPDGSVVDKVVIKHYFTTVSEYVHYGSLNNCLYNGIPDSATGVYRPLTSGEVFGLLHQVCELSQKFGRECGFVHGDYHHGNVGVTRRLDGSLKAVMYDFDFATMIGPDGEVFGTGADMDIDVPEWAYGGDESPAPPSGLDEDAYCRAIELVSNLYGNENGNLREEPEEDEEGNTVTLGVTYSPKLEELVRVEEGRYAVYGDSIYVAYNLFVELMNIRNKYKEDEAALKSKHPNVISREDATLVANKILDKYYEDGFNVFWRIYEMEQIGGFKFVAFILSKSPGAMRAVFPEVDLGIFYSDSPRCRLDLDGEGTGEAADAEAAGEAEEGGSQ